MPSVYETPVLKRLGIIVPVGDVPWPVHESRVFGDSVCIVPRHSCMNTLLVAGMRREMRAASSKPHPQAFAPSWVRQTKRAR